MSVLPVSLHLSYHPVWSAFSHANHCTHLYINLRPYLHAHLHTDRHTYLLIFLYAHLHTHSGPEPGVCHYQDLKSVVASRVRLVNRIDEVSRPPYHPTPLPCDVRYQHTRPGPRLRGGRSGEIATSTKQSEIKDTTTPFQHDFCEKCGCWHLISQGTSHSFCDAVSGFDVGPAATWQVLRHLLQNSIKFTQQGVIEVTAEQVGDYVRVHVQVPRL